MSGVRMNSGDGTIPDTCNCKGKIHTACLKSYSDIKNEKSDQSNKSSNTNNQHDSNAKADKAFCNDISEQIKLFQGQCSAMKEKLLDSAETKSTQKHSMNKKNANKADSKNTYRRKEITKDQGNNYNFEERLKPNKSNELSNKGRKQSASVGTDSNDGPTFTINNILQGITTSVNRLSDLQFHITSDPTKVANVSRFGVNNKKSSDQSTTENGTSDDKVASQESCTTSDPLQKDSLNIVDKLNPSLNNKQKFKKRSWKCKAKTSSTSLNLKKKPKPGPVKALNVITAKENKTLFEITQARNKKSKYVNNSDTKQYSEENKDKQTFDEVLELYHNAGIKESDSDDSLDRKRKSTSSKKIRPRSQRQNDMSKSVYNEEIHKDRGDGVKQQPSMTLDFNEGRSLSPIQEVDYGEGYENSPRFSSSSRNYELPTIASKMKQVCKTCYEQFNFQSIPFIASTSTSPSHNIGINIQQVMSVFKSKQTKYGIPPNLVHNIGVCAHRLNGRPYSALLSSIGSRLGSRLERQSCPLGNRINFLHLQEIAKEIPEENELEDDFYTIGNYNAAAGDPNAQNIWHSNEKTHCKCMTEPNLELGDVMHKYREQNNAVRPKPKSRINRPQSQCIQTSTLTSKLESSKQSAIPANENNPSKDQEKNLKEVLRNLHKEFETMNNKYDELEKLGKSGNNSKVKSQMEDLERNMTKKEEEIEVVMNLYNEVIALKKQIKVMKQKEEIQELYTSHSRTRAIKRAPRQAHHLTRLLRQIQNYQQLQKGIGLEGTSYC